MGKKDRRVGRLIKRLKRRLVREGSASGRLNVVRDPISLIREDDKGSYIPRCFLPYHWGTVRNDSGCVEKDCIHYRRFRVVYPARDVEPEIPGSTHYDKCPIDGPSSNSDLRDSISGDLEGLSDSSSP